MNYMKMVRDEINSITTKMTDKELFSSKVISDYLTNTLKAALGKTQGRRVSLHMMYDEGNPMDGYTTGLDVHINCGGPIVKMASSRKEKYFLILGILVHEVGHILYTDFPALKAFMECWWNTIWKKAEPPLAVDDPRFEQMVTELQELPNLANCWLSVIKNLQNIFEDGYIEQRLIIRFSGIFAVALRKLNRQLFDKQPSIAESLKEISQETDKDQKDMMFVAFLMNQILRYVKEFPENKGIWEPNYEMDQMYEQYDRFMETIRHLMDDLKYQRDSAVRYAEINEVVLGLYDYFPGKLEEESEETSERGDESSDESGSKTHTSLSRKDISTEMKSEKMPVIGSTAIPEGETMPVKDDAEAEDLLEKKERIKELSESEEFGSRKFESAMKEVIKEMAEAAVEDVHNKTLRKESKEIEDGILAGIDNPPEEWTYKIHREKTEYVRDYEKSEYESLMSELRSVSEPAKRKLNTVLIKRAEVGSTKGYQTGRFDPLQYPRACLSGDGRTFRQNRQPVGRPLIAFAILIDESGSMESGYPIYKCESAKRSAILLNDILTDVDVPHLIVGHTDFKGTCDLLMYHDFDEVDHHDKYRLAGITARNGNRDGAAIAYCCEKLMKRPEADKILIVISDGLPTESGYYSRNAKEDTEITIARFRKKGCRIIGAILDSYGSVESIYGRNNCLDMTDLKKVPVALSELVKRYILY